MLHGMAGQNNPCRRSLISAIAEQSAHRAGPCAPEKDLKSKNIETAVASMNLCLGRN